MNQPSQTFPPPVALAPALSWLSSGLGLYSLFAITELYVGASGSHHGLLFGPFILLVAPFMLTSFLPVSPLDVLAFFPESTLFHVIVVLATVGLASGFAGLLSRSQSMLTHCLAWVGVVLTSTVLILTLPFYLLV